MLNSSLSASLRLFVVVTFCCVPSDRTIAFDDEPEAVDGSGAEPDINVNDVDPGSLETTVEFVSDRAYFSDVLAFTLDASLWMGVDVAPISAALRTQLGLREDRGVVVTNVEPDGPGDQAGIRLHDVLLSAGGEPVNDPAVLQEQIDAAGEESLSIILMRGGKRMSMEVTPRNRNYDALTLETSQGYWIGIVADEVDDALRVQLGLPGETGLVVTEVYDEMAADEAGIEAHDILLEFDGTALESVEELNSRIQEVGDGTAIVLVVRGGDELSLKVSPRLREVGDEILWFVDHSASLYALDALKLTEADVTYINAGDGTFIDVAGGAGDSESVPQTTEEKLQDLILEMRDLTGRMRMLQQSLQSGVSGDATEDDVLDSPEVE